MKKEVTPKIIKKIVEENLNIEDISNISQKNYYKFARMLYFGVCDNFKFIDSRIFTLENISSTVHRTHGAGWNALKKLEEARETSGFIFESRYESIVNYIKEVYFKDNEDTPDEKEAIRNYYEKKIYLLNEKIDDLQDKINFLLKSDIINKINDMSKGEYVNFELKFKAIYAGIEYERKKRKE